VPLRDGDVIAIGPARFRVDGLAPTVVAAAPAGADPPGLADPAVDRWGSRRLRLAAAALVAAAVALAAAA
jgi:hypothetical protein